MTLMRMCRPSQVTAALRTISIGDWLPANHLKKLIIMSQVKVRIKRPPTRLVVVIAAALMICCAVASCNVTRTITNESQYYQRGDTAVFIQTKSIETYDASKKCNNYG